MVKPKNKLGRREFKKYMKEKCRKLGKQNKKENQSFIELMNVQETPSRAAFEEAAGSDVSAGDDVTGYSSMMPVSPIAANLSLLESFDKTSSRISPSVHMNPSDDKVNDKNELEDLNYDFQRISPSVHMNPSDDKNELEDLHYDFQRFPDEDLETIEFTGASDERRIVDLNYFLEELIKISNHSKAFGCGIDNLITNSDLYTQTVTQT